MNGKRAVFCAISGECLPEAAENLVKVMVRQSISRLFFMGAVGIYNEITAELDDAENVKMIPNRFRMPKRLTR